MAVSDWSDLRLLTIPLAIAKTTAHLIAVRCAIAI
jgi:hypothetical protein